MANNNIKTVYVKTEKQIHLIEKSCRIVAEALSLVGKNVKPGVTTLELDKIAEDYIKSQDARPAFKGYRVGPRVFPATLCMSVDDVVVHGIPSEKVLKEGEIISIDCGAERDGYFGDSAVTFAVGEISELKQRLMKITNESLFKGIEQAVDGNKIYDVARAIQEHVENNGYSVTRELVGHGIGKRLHEEPPVPNFVPALLHRQRYPNVKLRKGLALAIEPMVHAGAKEIIEDSDGWTIRTRDGMPAAHFEHTVIVDNGKAVILTLRD